MYTYSGVKTRHFKVEYVKKFLRKPVLLGDEQNYPLDEVKFYQMGIFYMANLRSFQNGGANEFALCVEKGNIDLFRAGKNDTPYRNEQKKLGLAKPPTITYYWCKGTDYIQEFKPKLVKTIFLADENSAHDFKQYRNMRMVSKLFQFSSTVLSTYGAINLFLEFREGTHPKDIATGNSKRDIIVPLLLSIGVQSFDNLIFNKLVLPRLIEKTIRAYNGTVPTPKGEIKELKMNETDSLNVEISEKGIDHSYSAYYKRVMAMKSNPMIKTVELKKTTYGSGETKWIGLKAKHRYGADENYLYKIGTWHLFYANGQIKEVLSYNLKERKNGPNIGYDEEGQITFEKEFLNGKLVKK